MNKAELRRQLKVKRQNMPHDEHAFKSKQICAKLDSLDWSGVHSIHCFQPIEQLNEVDVAAFLAAVQAKYPAIQLYTSRRIDGEWRVVSWQGHKITESLKFDAVIVPMLGFDTNLNRIGYGAGYYDQFLATQPQVQKIGVCFELGKLHHIQTEPHDIALDTIITESQIYVG